MSAIDHDQPHESVAAAEDGSQEPLLQDTEMNRNKPETRQSTWNLGHLTGIPAHLIGVLWVWCTCAGLYSDYPYSPGNSLLTLANSALQLCNLGVATLLVILQILLAYDVAILASNDRWRRPARLRVPFLKGLMISLDVLLIISLLFCTIMVALNLSNNRWDFARLLTGCVFAVIAAGHYTIILLGKLARGKIRLHLTFQRGAAKTSTPAQPVPPVEPYRDTEENTQASRNDAVTG